MQGFNMGRYVPPDVEGVASFNQASGKKPTNRKPDGTQTVRFECPFPLWCTTCNPEVIIGQGVRFNAEKKKVGQYLSTPIWSFRFKHNICGAWIEVRTDPKNTEYVVVDGGRRRAEKALDDDEFGLRALVEPKEGDVLGQLEKRAEEKEIVDEQKRRIEDLKRRQERDWADPYAMNKKVRREFRVGRRQRQDDEKTGEELKEKFGLGVDLIAPVKEDGQRAKLIDFGAREGNDIGVTGIFENMRPISRPEKGRGKRGGPDLMAMRKSALQHSWKGNTRARTDPFLQQDQWSRKPSSKTKVTSPRGLEGVTVEAGERETATRNDTTPAILVAYDSD